MATSCSYQTINLTAGEQYTLPPGATLVAASNPDNVTSDGCLDKTQLEEIQCYVAKLVGFDNDNSAGEWFEIDTNKLFIVGHRLNGVFYPTGPWGPGYWGDSYSGSWLADLASRIPGILDYNATNTNDGSNFNMIYVHQIKTFPSIGDNLEIVIQAQAENFLEDGAGNPLPVTYYVKFENRAVADSRGLPPSLC